jgi:glyoxylase-like metal-dependent hydrolase (beta-lactamase superfamily II)
LIAALALALQVAAPQAPDSLLADLARAYRVYAASGAEHVVYHGIGVEHRSAEVQGYGPHRQSVARNEIWLGIAPASRTVLYEYRIGRHDGSERWRRRVVRGDTSMVWDFLDEFASARRDAAADVARNRLSRFLPHALVREAFGGGARLEHRPDARFLGRPVSVVRATFVGETVPIDLLIDARAKQLLAARYALEFPGIGPTTLTQEFLDHRRDDALGWVPTRIVTRLDTAVYRELGVTRAERSRALMDSLMRSPRARMPAAPATGTSGMSMARPLRDTIIEVSPGAHVLRGIGGRYNMFIVEQPDGLFVAEAPAIHPSLDDWPTAPVEDMTRLSRDAIAIIAQRFPGVPIARVMPTHFHSDHAAGVRAFVEVGARIVATGGDSAYYARLLARDGSSSSAVPQFDVFSDSAAFGDAEDPLMVHTVRRGVHAEDNSFVWLPRARVLFQGDLFYVDADGSQPPSRMGVMREFAEFLERRGIAPEIMWGMHGNVPATPEHLARVRGR